MKSSYAIIKETDSRIKLAESWYKRGFSFFGESTILQAYDAVERFERRLNRPGLVERVINDDAKNLFSSLFVKYINEKMITLDVSKILRDNIKGAVEVMELKRKWERESEFGVH